MVSIANLIIIKNGNVRNLAFFEYNLSDCVHSRPWPTFWLRKYQHVMLLEEVLTESVDSLVLKRSFIAFFARGCSFISESLQTSWLTLATTG